MPKQIKSIRRFEEKDVMGPNQVEAKGFASTHTFAEMLEHAMENDCNLIIKCGVRGKWYLKNRDYKKTKEVLKTPEKYNRKSHTCYIIKYVE